MRSRGPDMDTRQGGKDSLGVHVLIHRKSALGQDWDKVTLGVPEVDLQASFPPRTAHQALVALELSFASSNSFYFCFLQTPDLNGRFFLLSFQYFHKYCVIHLL